MRPTRDKVTDMTALRTAASIALVIWTLASCAGGQAMAAQSRPDDRCAALDRPARLLPDFGSAVLPPNIAPLSFQILEKGDAYYVRIASKKGPAIEIAGPSGLIRSNSRAWHRLLTENRGDD